MGYTVLYVAFGGVAVWLLGEVLFQHKARLRWRLLAFGGFLGVVAGVVFAQVAVVGLGVVCFAAGQVQVTLSHRRGFTAGWAVASRPGADRRRNRRAAPDPADPHAVPGRDADPYAQPAPYGAAQDEGAGQDTAVFAPVTAADAGPAPLYPTAPVPDDTGEYGIYSDRSSYVSDPYTTGGYEGYGAQGYGSEWQQEQPAAAAGSFGAVDDDVFANGAPQPDAAPAGHGGYGHQPYGDAPYQEQGGYEQPVHQGWEQPAPGPTGWEQAPYEQPGYGQPAYDQGGYDRSGYDQGGYGAPYDPYAAGPDQGGHPGYDGYDGYGQYPQQPYAAQGQPEQQGYGYDDGTRPGHPQPHIPQQAGTGHDQPEPTGPYDPRHPYGY